MKASRLLVVSVCLALFCIVCAPHARADQWNQATKATFNEPIEIPGRVLSAGTTGSLCCVMIRTEISFRSGMPTARSYWPQS
jgi:hypothetical protein